MNNESIQQLVTIVEAKYQAELANVTALLREERLLRENLQKIDHDSKSAKENLGAELAYIKKFGADILWQSFLSQKKRTVERKLSLILARKSDAMLMLQNAHRRQEAVRTLSEEYDQNLKVARRKREESAMRDACLLNDAPRILCPIRRPDAQDL